MNRSSISAFEQFTHSPLGAAGSSYFNDAVPEIDDIDQLFPSSKLFSSFHVSPIDLGGLLEAAPQAIPALLPTIPARGICR